jgi:hypothetical protein
MAFRPFLGMHYHSAPREQNYPVSATFLNCFGLDKYSIDFNNAYRGNVFIDN